MKKYTFNTNSSKSNNSIFTPSEPDYSKILDNLILTDIKEKNSYLFDYNTDDNYYGADIIIGGTKKAYDFTKAATYLANILNKKKIIIGKTYKLIDGTPIIFYDDEIQIGFDIFKYSDFYNYDFLKAIEPKTKKIIIDIYLNSNKIDINIK